MSKWIGNRNMNGNAEVFGAYYTGGTKYKQAKIKQKKLNKSK